MAFGPPSQYDPSSFGISFLVRWNGTILPLVTSSPLFWLLIFIHCLNLYLFNTFEGEEPLLDWKAAMVTSSLLTFQLVSYGQQCLARYFALYQFCTGLHGACMEWAALIKLEFGHHSHAVQWNILRFMLGALQVHYALLGGDEVDVGGIAKKGISDDEWRAIRSRNLLSHDETERLKAYGGFKPFMPVGWALAEVKGKLLGVSAAEADRTPIGDNVPTRLAFDRFNQVAFKFRSDSSQTFAMLNAPLPFAYFHILKMLLLLSLGIISYALTGLLDGQVVLSMVVFVLVCLVMVGLAEIAIAMSDPFGEDEADFDLDAFLASVYNNSVAYLLDTHSVHLDGLPQGMHNPLDDDQSHLRVWKDDVMQHGLVDRRKSALAAQMSMPSSAGSTRSALQVFGLLVTLGTCSATRCGQIFTQYGHLLRRGRAPLLMASTDDTDLYASLRKRIAVEDRPEDRPTIRPGSIRPDGIDGAGMRFADASLASTTGPVFNADDLPAGEVLTPARAIKGLYAAFNARDAACVASFLTDDCVYEDLLLGPATVCRGKAAFMGALKYHPAFISSKVLDGLPFAKLLPALTLEVDSIAEGADTVGVEWHVQCGDAAFPLGRGLSQAQMCTDTGKIVRVVDIAEAPWRVIGLLVLPFITAFTTVAASLKESAKTDEAAAAAGDTGAADGSGDAASDDAAARAPDVEREYELLLSAVLADDLVEPAERALLASYAAENRVSDDLHVRLLAKAGWTEDEYAEGSRRDADGAV